ncbi:MAG TPA: AraC family transcriptional regulator [Clostridiales bacterium]|nr:AraC family transcriptional regulator [Clostridiales bacterium]
MPIYFSLSPHNLPLTVDSIGNQWNQEHVRRARGYPHYHWLQTNRGVGEIDLSGKRLVLPQGCGILIAPFVPHVYYSKEGEWTTSFVTFAGELASGINKIVGYEPYILAQDTTEFSFQNWIDQTIACYESHQIDPVRLSIGCYSFLINIQRLRKYRVFTHHPLYQQYVAPVIKEIETSYSEDLTVCRLAGTVYVTPQYLSRLFHRFLGMSTGMFLRNFRMNKAKELLITHPELEIQQVGYRVGYPDASHFIAVFRNTIGNTPLEFRQMHISKN